MRLIGLFIIVTFSLFLSTTAFAQGSQVGGQPSSSQCARLWLPLNADVNVLLKDKQKLKGKLIAIQADQFEIINHKKRQIIFCADVAIIERRHGLGHRLKVAVAIPIALAGAVIALPGTIVAAAGAKDAGLVIATPGLFLVIAGAELSGSDMTGLALLFR